MSLDGRTPAISEPYSGEWECMECGHIEAGEKQRRPEVCPECGAPSQALEFFSYEEEDEAGWDADTSEDPDDVLDHSVGPEEDDVRA